MTDTTTTQELLERIHREFPALAWGRYGHISAGWDHDVILLDDKLVFRFPKSKEYLALLKDEVGLLGFLGGKVRTRIPNYTYVAKDSSFAGYEFISGDPLTKSEFATLSSLYKEAVAAQLADFFTVLHTISAAELAPYSIPHRVPFAYDLEKLSKQYLELHLTKDDYSYILQLQEELREAGLAEGELAVIHGDISPKHILWDKKTERIGLIDFSDRRIDDPALDFTELYFYGPEFVEQVYSRYQGKRDKVFLDRAKLYFKRTGAYLLIDSLRGGKVEFQEARQVFDYARSL